MPKLCSKVLMQSLKYIKLSFPDSSPKYMEYIVRGQKNLESKNHCIVHSMHILSLAIILYIFK